MRGFGPKMTAHSGARAGELLPTLANFRQTRTARRGTRNACQRHRGKLSAVEACWLLRPRLALKSLSFRPGILLALAVGPARQRGRGERRGHHVSFAEEPGYLQELFEQAPGFMC